MANRNSTDSKQSGKSVTPASREDFMRWADEWADAGNWFPFRRQLLGIMSPAAAVIVQSLINLGRKKSKDGWVKCTASHIKQGLYLSRRVQDRAFTELKSAGYVEVSLRGLPAMRWVLLRREAMERAMDRLDEATELQLHQNVQTRCAETRNNKHKSSSTKKTKEYADPPCGSAHTGDGRPNAAPAQPPSNGAQPAHSRHTPAPHGGARPPKETARHTRLRPAGGSAAGPGEGNQPSHQDSDMLGNEPKAAVLPIDTARADRLRRFVVQKGWRVSTAKKNWAVAAARLRRVLTKQGRDNIDAVLDFITRTNLGKPSVTSFAQLAGARVWDWVNDLLRKDAESHSGVTVTPDAEEIVGLIRRGRPLPAAADQQLPQAVQLSLDNVNGFRDRVVERYPDWKTGRDASGGFAKRVLNTFTDTFVQEWFEGVAAWADGKERLKLIPKWVVTPAHDDFQAAGRSAARAFGSEEYWDDLMKEVGA